MLAALILVFGVGCFLAGIGWLREGLAGCFSKRIKQLLQVATGTPIRGFATGTLVTMLIQSSTAVSVIAMGLVGAGLMTFEQSVGIILGTNVGTCVTVQLLALDLARYFWFPVLAGAALYLIQGRTRSMGLALFGFGLIFAGLYFFGLALEPLSRTASFQLLLNRATNSPWYSMLAAMIMTALIHSSSTVTGITIALASKGLISLETALAFMLGSNIGTCFTAVIASFNGPQVARRVAAAHVLLNVGGVIVFFPFLGPFAKLIYLLSDHPASQIANAHTFFNVASSLAILPLAGAFARLVKALVPDRF